MSSQGAHVQSQAILDKLDHIDNFFHARDAGVILLHRHDLLDVFNVLLEQGKFLKRALLFREEMLGELSKVGRELSALGVGAKEFGETVLIFKQKSADAGKLRALGA